jgi:hypothetical protein
VRVAVNDGENGGVGELLFGVIRQGFRSGDRVRILRREVAADPHIDADVRLEVVLDQSVAEHVVVVLTGVAIQHGSPRSRAAVTTGACL